MQGPLYVIFAQEDLDRKFTYSLIFLPNIMEHTMDLDLKTKTVALPNSDD